MKRGLRAVRRHYRVNVFEEDVEWHIAEKVREYEEMKERWWWTRIPTTDPGQTGIRAG
jgi:hypothetical protein